ncbi:MAG: UDP-3-O-(3-hydroxymyristoyl)glucosamine N-acyltransferase [Phycisphaerae bacterium]|nr:UDP-3-O-(3-hydroxymyristoyl)glucosamine N-acyltransferase [Phycisphaerae bacterium]NIS50188.1 UDP-3-O-(3-hydroxymyristoyl)glucosamine N-acyltransferase [Phycisphaerae bacterium]NIU11439.1 UDP-3-O-(3-hydroxymyristoyl)glucosamine N-acyltransferase [Phycisphaerae bacterium]NIU56488.1 UDP-3-O-(3-hydroxymyristoyl)glucosamine N-acyltransferase [Phycisphaerae bacterium]NIV01834.1 UDP-3-O-(3-hydroxymyristoyl)glucosamine N-acyltransferase [Phycisphaerae bacterium]
MKLTVAQLAERLGAELTGDGSGQISAVGPLKTAGENEVAFIRGAKQDHVHFGTTADEKLISAVKRSLAGAVITGSRIEDSDKPQLIVKNVNAALIEALKIFAPTLKPATTGIDPSAKVAGSAKIAGSAAIGAYVVIEDGAEVGANSVIAGGCKIGENSKIGNNCRLDSNVVVYHNCHIGNNVVIQANTTIGSTGFGYSFIEGSHRLIPHNGGVVIEDFVEIGANCCVDRAKFGETRIGAGTKIDNLVQIAHNVVIGKNCLIAGLVGISGSCRLGDGVVLAGQVGLADNIEIGDNVIVGAQAGVINNIKSGERVVGSPAINSKDAFQIAVLTKRLPKLFNQLKQLCKRVDKVESSKDD